MRYLILLIFSFATCTCYSQKSYSNSKSLFQDTTIENEHYKIDVSKISVKDNGVKLNLKILNKTSHYLVIKANEISFLSKSKIFVYKGRNIVVNPNEEEIEVIYLKGTNLQANSFLLSIDNIYKASAEGQIIRVPTFNLPPTKNEFAIGNFSCTVLKSETKQKNTSVKFRCQYNGDDIGIINSNKCIAVLANGEETPNMKKQRALVLEQNQRGTFVATFSNNATSNLEKTTAINWNETFRLSKLVSVDSLKIEIVKKSSKK